MSSSRDQFFHKIDSIIQSAGFAAICVGADSDSPFFAYTVGITETYACPELLIFGVNEKIAKAVFHAIAKKINAGERFSDGDVLVDVLNLPCAIRSITEEAAHPFALNVSSRYLGSAYKPTYQQVVYPDIAGIFPWELGYNARMRKIQTELWQPFN